MIESRQVERRDMFCLLFLYVLHVLDKHIFRMKKEIDCVTMGDNDE